MSDHQNLDWDKGLPIDILSQIAQCLPASEVVGMNGVSKNWHVAFAMSVCSVDMKKVPPRAHFLPELFSRLQHVTIAHYQIHPEYNLSNGLGLLQRFPKLNSLAIGDNVFTDDDAEQLSSLGLTNLDMRECDLVTDVGLESVLENPLTSLNLQGCNISELDLEQLRGLPLSKLILGPTEGFSDQKKDFLLGMPLKELDIRTSFHDPLGGEHGLIEALGQLSLLTSLALADFDLTSEEMGLILADKPLLQTLVLVASMQPIDASLARLRGMPLTSLDLCGSNIGNAGLAHFRGLPLASLDLSWNPRITFTGLARLRGLPLTSLDLSRCLKAVTPAGLAHLRRLPLTSLSLCKCPVKDEGLEALRGLPVTFLDLTSCMLLTKKGIQALRVLPNLTLLCAVANGFRGSDLHDLGWVGDRRYDMHRRA